MKKTFHYSLMGAVLPIALYTLVSAKSDIPETKPVEPVARPYLVEVINPFGQREGEYRGTSLALEPISISREIGTNPHELDKFETFPPIEMGIGSKITQYITPSYEIRDGKKVMGARSWAENVGELLLENKVTLGEEDKINFSLDTVLTPNMKIVIIRVERTKVVESEPIDYKTIKKDDPNLDQGKTRIEQKGKRGEKKFIYEVIREDGTEVSKKLLETEIAVEPVDEIIRIGTKPVITVPCKFNDIVIEAATKNGLDPNSLCIRMIKESRGNPNSDGGMYKGLFQYEEGFWKSASSKAGYAGASIWDAKAQIHVTAWAWSHGYRGRWPRD